MKKLIKIICEVYLLTAFVSCNSFINLKPISTLTNDNAYQTASDAEAALIGAYNTFYAEYYIWDDMLLQDVRSDNAYAGSLDDVNIDQYESINISSTNSRIFANWEALYNGIARCNLILQNVPNISDPSLSPERKSQILGEAHFLRAFQYFQLVKMYGGVPIVLISESADASKIQIPKNTEKEVYDLITTDLQYAAHELPYSFGSDNVLNSTRATKGAAYALLAKSWAQRPDRDYHKVSLYCDSVINAGYTLVDNFSDLFDGNHYSNSETILEVPFVADTPEGNWGPQLLLPPSVTSDDWSKYATPAQDLVQLFLQEGDSIRFNASIIWERVDWTDKYWSPNPQQNPIPFPFKMKHANNWSSGDYEYLLRLDDILLLKAEAMYYNKDGDWGRSLINQIRNRVHLPNTNASDVNLLTAILNERRLELCFEAQRWDDLVRNGIAVQTMNAIKINNLITGNVDSYSIDTHDLILPIPIFEIERNPKLIQNPGY